MKKKNNLKAWLYLLPAILFLGVFMIYPLIDVCIYSVEENYASIARTYTGIGLGNFRDVLSDRLFIQALKNTFILVAITVPVSTGLSLLIALCLSSIKVLKKAFQTIYFLPYVTNTLAVGLVFMILFDKTEYTKGLVNMLLRTDIDFIDGEYWMKMMVTCLYTVWIVMPFKILILTSARTADAVGIDVTKYKYVATCIGSGIAGLGGFYYIIDYMASQEAYLSVEALGWLSIALVIFALWRPHLTIIGSTVFGILFMRKNKE